MNHSFLFLFLLLAINAHSQEGLRKNSTHGLHVGSSIETDQFDFQSYWSGLQKINTSFALQQQSVVFQKSKLTYSPDVDFRLNRWKYKKLKKGTQLLFAIPYYLMGGEGMQTWEMARKKRKLNAFYGIGL